MPKHSNKFGILIFFLIIAIPSFFIITNAITSTSSYDISPRGELPFSIGDNNWEEDDGNLKFQSPLSNGGKKWTLIQYGAHDNDIPVSYPDIGSSDDVDVFVIEDGLGGGNSRAAYIHSGGSRTYLNLTSINPSWGEELNTGHPDTLYYILKYCIDNYPSNYYWVILDNHGGAYNGVCWDDTSEDNLSIGDLKTVFSNISSYLGRKFDGIYFHACLMSNMEIAVQLSPYVGYIVGFEPSVSMGGFNLDNDVVIETLVNNPSLSPQDFAIELVDQAFISEMGDTLIAAIKLSIIEDLIDDINNLATQLMNNFKIYGKEIINARDASESWYGVPTRLIDFIDFLQELYERVPNQLIRNYALKIMKALGPSDQDYAILKHRKGSLRYYMHGLSIYFPESLSGYSSYYEQGSDFCALTNWEEFLQVFYENDVDATITPFGNSYVFFIILGVLPLVIIGGKNVIFKKR